MNIDWAIDGIAVRVCVSNIIWDNDSVGMTEFWGFLKDDEKEDYISDFSVDEIKIMHESINDLENIKILQHNWHQDVDFVAKLEDEVRYD
tara:strand:- start:201 stop:470 length:270 start_codon:yes stop_codon:yes gene_type:complete